MMADPAFSATGGRAPIGSSGLLSPIKADASLQTQRRSQLDRLSYHALSMISIPSFVPSAKTAGRKAGALDNSASQVPEARRDDAVSARAQSERTKKKRRNV
jgi:hypothetical protein